MQFAKHLGISAVLWLVVTGADEDSFVIGVPTIVLTASSMSWLAGPSSSRWSFVHSIPFLFYFLRASLISGLDVARRVLQPRMSLDPGFIQFSMLIAPGAAQVFFTNTVSMLPGTLSADVQGDQLCVHVIDKAQRNEENLRELERHVRRLFRLHSDDQVERNERKE